MTVKSLIIWHSIWFSRKKFCGAMHNNPPHSIVLETMRLLFFIFSFSLFTSVANAQVKASELKIDYGEITADTPLEREVFFVNESSEKMFLLTHEVPRELSAHVSAKQAFAGDTIFLRWKFNPMREGIYQEIITLWFSTMDKPTILKIKGNVKYIDPYANPSCPSFAQRPPGQEKKFITDFLVLDSLSGEPIKDASIRLIDRGITQAHYYTDKKGEHSAQIPIRYFYFLVEADGYEDKDLYSYVNAKKHRFVFELNPLEEPEVEMAYAQEEILVEEEPIKVEPEIEETVEEVPKTEEPLADFDERLYAPNNIVFLVDVSGSMNQNGRMDILKAAMIELTEMVRPQDKISLISYARDANVLLQPTSGSEKEEIISEIRALSPSGSTNGAKGLKQAYQTAKSSFISGGNNRVYIATDGVFKVSENEAINKMVIKNSRRKILLSVLGIKGTKYTKEKMAELAKLGKGDFLDMESYDESAADLKAMVKRQSRRN